MKRDKMNAGRMIMIVGDENGLEIIVEHAFCLLRLTPSFGSRWERC